MARKTGPTAVPFRSRVGDRHGRAWLLLVGALALHVADEALTDFLDFYNPLVQRIRAEIAWFPMPTFTFGVWLTGLIVGVLVLALLGRFVSRGTAAGMLLSWLLSAIMVLNGLGHLGGSLYFRRWLPGTTSAPVLLFASGWLAWVTWQRTTNPAR